MENVDLSELQKERLDIDREVATSIGPTRTSHYLPDLSRPSAESCVDVGLCGPEGCLSQLEASGAHCTYKLQVFASDCSKHNLPIQDR